MKSAEKTKPGIVIWARRRLPRSFNDFSWPARPCVAAMAKGSAFVGIALAVLLGLEVVLERQVGEPPVVVPGEGLKPFSREWLRSFEGGAPGCLNPAMDTYTWRLAGWGSNMNTLLLQWAEGLVSGRKNLAVIFDSNWPWFKQTTCEEASGGVETIGGWRCIFQEMPHLCIFDNTQGWEDSLTPLAVSRIEKRHAEGRMGDAYARRKKRFLRQSLMGTGTNDMGALSALLDYIYSHFQPWFRDAIRDILDEPGIASLGQDTYVGMHIRRTDKILAEANKTETVEYFEAAAKYLNSTVKSPSVTEISGVWLSSDDSSVFAEGYDAMVLLMAELRMLAEADVFSGTFSSNIGRMVVLMRNYLRKPRRSAVAADKQRWRSG